jgi:hypothetical protein
MKYIFKGKSTCLNDYSIILGNKILNTWHWIVELVMLVSYSKGQTTTNVNPKILIT